MSHEGPVIVLSQSLSQAISTPKHNKTFLTKRMRERKAHFDRLWLREPETFLENSPKDLFKWELAQTLLPSTEKHLSLLDLGCGCGAFSLVAKEKGYEVSASEISSHALKHLDSLRERGISLFCEQLPFTHFDDNSFDIIVALDVLEELTPKEYRLCFSEFSRLLKPEGKVLLSVMLDQKTEDPDRRFLGLVNTEFDTLKVLKAHHQLFDLLSPIFKKKSSLWMKPLSKISSFFWGQRSATQLFYLGEKRSIYKQPPFNPLVLT